MDLVQLLNSLVANIAELQAKLADAGAAATALAGAKFEQGKEAGIAEGKALMQTELDALNAKVAELEAKILELQAGQPVSDKIYSQAELDAKLAEVLANKQAEIDAAVLAKKQEIVAKIKAVKADDEALIAELEA